MSKPEPIPPDPRAGQFQFVISFRSGPMRTPMDRWLRDLRGQLAAWAGHHSVDLEGLDVAIREIGAQGEASQFEGEGPEPDFPRGESETVQGRRRR